MLTTKKPPALLGALMVATLVPLLFGGCADPGPRALLQGDRFLRKADFARAIEKLERATRLLPKEARAWNHLGLAYHGAGRREQAVKAYQQALTLDRNLAAAHYNLGCLQLEQTNAPAAVAELISYTGLQPNVLDGWIQLGLAQLRARQTDAAEKSFHQALKLSPRSAEAWNGIGLAQVQRRRYAEACQQFNTAQRARPDFSPALLNAAIVSYQYLNGRELALHKFRQYLALDPLAPDAAGIQQIVNQLDLELHPPAQPPPATPPPQLASSSRTQAPAPPANQPAPSILTNKSSAVAELPTTTAPPPRVNSATSPPAPRVAANPASPPARTEPAPAPLPKVEVVRLTEEEPVKAARDIAQNFEARSTGTALPPAVSGSAPGSNFAAGANDPAGAKNADASGFNPRNGFQSSDRTRAPVATAGGASPELAGQTGKGVTVAKASGPTASSQPGVQRYAYRSPAAPKPGNRGEAERWLARGVQAQERDRLSEAIEAYRQAADADPSFFDARYNLGVAAYESGNWTLCLTAYEYALAIDPVSVKARFNFAISLQKANYPRDAANELEKLLALNASEARAHFALANLYAYQLGDSAAAREHYLHLLELDPQHPQATAVRYWLEAHP